MMPETPPPQQRIEKRAPGNSSDDINVEKVRALLRKKRNDAGQTPASGTDLAMADVNESGEIDPKQVLAIIQQTRACAIKNAQSSESLKEAQAATPGRGFRSGKFKTRGVQPSPNVSQDRHDGAKKDQSS